VFLLDTDVVSNTRLAKPHPRLLQWLEARGPDELAISATTIFEIEAGICLLELEGKAAKAVEVRSWLDGLVASGGLPILPIDHRVARLYGRMFTTPALCNFVVPDIRTPKPKSGADLIIAATAVAHEAAIATNNAADFVAIHRHFPLPGIYKPFTDEWVVAR
jgi:predicted nucleic acid-binding protein